MTVVIYGTTGGADTYHTDRGNALWSTLTPTAKAVSLARASEYIDGKYRGAFPGYRTSLRGQEREWPRQGAFDREGNSITSTEIPVEVINATYEAALRDATSSGSLITDVTLGKNIVKAAVEGAVSVEYAGASSAMDLQLTIPAVDRILAPILTGGAGLSSALSVASVRG